MCNLQKQMIDQVEGLSDKTRKLMLENYSSIFWHMGYDPLLILGAENVKTDMEVSGEYFKEDKTFVIKDNGPFTLTLTVDRYRSDCEIYHVNTCLYGGVKC